jgi:hypothetical protein
VANCPGWVKLEVPPPKLELIFPPPLRANGFPGLAGEEEKGFALNGEVAGEKGLAGVGTNVDAE